MKRRVATILLAIFLIIPLFFAAVAQTPYNTKEDVGQANDDFRTNGDVTSPVHVADVETARQWVLVCQSIGIGCTADESQQSSFQQNSVIGQISNGIAYLYYQKPADTSQFIAYYGQKLGIVKPAYAQGIGFSGLSPLLGLWRTFRNVAYGFTIIIMVVIGFMIMFRMKIDPRTVISAQSAIPRIIMTIFLITFSYAIVGLLIDVMYLFLFLIINVLRTSGAATFPDFQAVLTNFSGGSISNLLGALFTPGIKAVDDITALVGGASTAGVTALIGAVVGAIVLVPLTPLGGAAAGAAIGGAIPSVLVFLLVAIAIIFATVRIFIMLLTAYIQIIINVIFAPLLLMFDAIPNSNAASSWIRGIIANLLVFPITSSLLLVGAILTSSSISQNLWSPPGLPGSASRGVAGLIGLGLILTIPTLVNSMKEAFKAKSAVPAAPGAFLSPVGTMFGVGMQALSAQYYLTSGPLGQWFGRLRGAAQGKPVPPGGSGGGTHTGQ